MDREPRLSVSPAELSRDILHLLAVDEERNFAQIAKGLGSRDASKPRRAIEKYLGTLELFGLGKVSSTGVTLTQRGLRFRASTSLSIAAARAAFRFANVPAAVFKILSSATRFTKDDARKRLAALGRETEVDLWLEWLESCHLVEDNDDFIEFVQPANRPIDLYSSEETVLIDEDLYRELVSMHVDNPSGETSYTFKALARLLKAFRDAPPEQSETLMQLFIQSAMMVLGIRVQTRNGPREEGLPSTGGIAHFGPEGEDAVGFFLRPPIVLAEDCIGLVLPMELKRTASDKKAVGQAATAAGRWRQHFGGKAIVIPITISDSETYDEKAAREYAASNHIVHIPIEALMQLVCLQRDRFCSARALITPVHLWTLLSDSERTAYTEPTTSDVVHGIGEILQDKIS